MTRTTHKVKIHCQLIEAVVAALANVTDSTNGKHAAVEKCRSQLTEMVYLRNDPKGEVYLTEEMLDDIERFMDWHPEPFIWSWVAVELLRLREGRT